MLVRYVVYIINKTQTRSSSSNHINSSTCHLTLANSSCQLYVHGLMHPTVYCTTLIQFEAIVIGFGYYCHYAFHCALLGCHSICNVIGVVIMSNLLSTFYVFSLLLSLSSCLFCWYLSLISTIFTFLDILKLCCFILSLVSIIS